MVKHRWGFAGLLGGVLGSVLGYSLASPRSQIVGRTTWHGPRNRREIALTFDNGPSPEGTPRILDLLEFERVPATFFVLGNAVEEHPDLARQIAQAGHQIGNHGYTHRNLLWAGLNATVQQMNRGYRAIESVCNVQPTLYRPAYGTRNFFMPHLLEMRGWQMVHWSASARDAGVNGTRNLGGWLPQVSGGDILLWHDGPRSAGRDPRRTTIAALSQVIPYLRDRGFKFVTLDQMLRTGDQSHTSADAA
jgi:peptidoglycan-N-acetylglucosamine deacetylase